MLKFSKEKYLSNTKLDKNYLKSIDKWLSICDGQLVKKKTKGGKNPMYMLENGFVVSGMGLIDNG